MSLMSRYNCSLRLSSAAASMLSWLRDSDSEVRMLLMNPTILLNKPVPLRGLRSFPCQKFKIDFSLHLPHRLRIAFSVR